MNFDFFKKDSAKIYVYSVLLFLLILPLSLQINFYQNDDWVYYKNVEWFMLGNFALHPYLGPTFYSQGIIAAIFSIFFTIQKLPVLTLVFSTLNFMLLARILVTSFSFSHKRALVIALLFFFSPINFYSVLGFMTDTYFVFFFLLGIHFFLQYERTGLKKDQLGIYVTYVLGLFVRQVSLVIPLSIGLYYVTTKRFKQAVLPLLAFAAGFIYLETLFPITPAMEGARLQYFHLLRNDYTNSLILGVLILLVAFLCPLFIVSVDFKRIFASRIKVFLVFILALTLYIGLSQIFKPNEISWGEFPYFENTFERTGYYPRGLHGTKYQFVGNYDLYKYWDLAAKLALCGYLASMLVLKNLKINFFAILGAAYVFILILTETFFDRYILVLIPIATLYLCSVPSSLKVSRLFYYAVGPFLLFIAFFAYQFSMDFVLVNKYVWGKSTSLVDSKKANPEKIHGTNAWKLTYRNTERDYTYKFSYDTQKINSELFDLYDLVEVHAISYPGNFFVNPNIYLYRLKND